MSRPLRIEYPGAVYHVTSRGNVRSIIYRDNEDRKRFLNVLVSVVERYNWLCYAYCLMDNHYHLVLETPDGNLSAGMRHLNGVYTQQHNRRHQKAGHVFEGRYKAILVDRDSYLLEVCRYVVLNPVRAGMVKAPDEWAWSSYRETSGVTADATPHFLFTEGVLALFSEGRHEARIQYRLFVNNGTAAPSPWNRLNGDILLGNDAFVESRKSLLQPSQKIEEIPRRQRFAGRLSLQELWRNALSHDKNQRNHLVVEAHVRFGYTMKEIAEFLDIHYTTVSKIVKATG